MRTPFRLLLLLLFACGATWVMFDWMFRGRIPDSFLLLHSCVLLGGMFALAWRFLPRREKPPGLLPMLLVGLLVERLLLSVFCGAMDHGLSNVLDSMGRGIPEGFQVACGIGMGVAVMGLFLLGGLAAMCALAGVWDFSWAKACMASAGMAGVALGSMAALGFALDRLRVGDRMIEWYLQLLALVFELAWLSWWSGRIRNRLREGQA